jgi:hypothetical protein
MTQQVNEYKGFSLFSDIEDISLRNRNRAVVLANIAEDHVNKEKRISPKGAALVLGYFSQIPTDERDGVMQRFSENMKQRGFQLVK